MRNYLSLLWALIEGALWPDLVCYDLTAKGKAAVSESKAAGKVQS